MVNSISGSFFIPKDAIVTNIECEVLKENNVLVKGVQYQIIYGVESIVDSISRKPIFKLTDNPNVRKITSNPDLGLAFKINSEDPGNELSVVYRIDTNTNYVYKISFLYLRYATSLESPTTTPGYMENYLLGADWMSYLEIIKFLQNNRQESVEGVIIKRDNQWLPFLNLKPSSLIPAEFIEEDDDIDSEKNS